MTEKQPSPLFGPALLCACLFATLLAGCNRGDQRTVDMQNPMTTGPIVYVALGDSTGAGVGARDGGYVARLFKRILERRPESKLTNVCVSGATTDDVLRSQLERAVAANPDLVTLGIGINDIGHGVTLDQFSRNYEQILSTLREQTRARIVVTNIPDISSAPRIPGPTRNEYQQLIIQFNRRLEEIAARHGATIFDVYTITTQELPSHPEYFSGDGFHPSDAGYELWAEQMWPTMAQVIGEAE
jgi:lysophospholipase L1-like esterase